MHSPRNTHTQFSLKSLLLTTTISAMLLALLTAIGTTPWHIVIGFVVFGTVVAAMVVAIELAYRVLGLR